MRQDAIQQNGHDGNEDGVQSEGEDRLGNNILGQLGMMKQCRVFFLLREGNLKKRNALMDN